MDIAGLRGEFPILQRATYLNSCSLGALSWRAQERVARFHAEWHEHGASAWYEAWMGRLSELRAAVARLIGGRSDEVALGSSTSAALAVIASALDYRERNRVVVSELDFPTVAYQWMSRPGVEVVLVPSDDGVTVDPERFAEAVDERTALVATCHVFFTTGAIQDLAELARIAHRGGALLLVDAYQSAGQVPIDVRVSDVDFLVTGPLKWLLGGPGLAYTWVRRELASRLRPRAAGWLGHRDPFAFDIESYQPHEDARRFELGTPGLHAVHAALGGQSIIEEVGVERIRARNASLTERLIEGALAAGLRLDVAPRPEDRSAIVMVSSRDAPAAVARLAAERIIVDARGSHVRVSPHFYNTEEEIDRVVDALARAAEGG